MKRHAAAKIRQQAVTALATAKVQAAIWQSMAMMPAEAKRVMKPKRKSQAKRELTPSEISVIESLLRRGRDVRAVAIMFGVRVGTVRTILARIVISRHAPASGSPSHEPSRRLGGAPA